MLKIKDTVDLKELEKYGFKLYISENYRTGRKMEAWINSKGIEIRNYKTKGGIRIISNPHYLSHSKDQFDVVYDLIKADLVEMV